MSSGAMKLRTLVDGVPSDLPVVPVIGAALPVTPVAVSGTTKTIPEHLAGKAPTNSPTFTGTSRFEGEVQTIKGLFAYTDGVPPNDNFSMQSIYTVNYGPATATGFAQTYISFATNPNFDVAHQIVSDFRTSNSSSQQSKLGQFIQVGSPPMLTGKVGAAVAEWNLTNRGADTGYQASISSPSTYGGTVPLQQVGGLNLVPEANFSGAAGVGTNVTYGVMVSRSSNLSTRLSDGAGNNDYSRTHTGYGTDRDSLVPGARAVGGEGGRGFSFWGGTAAPLAPYGVGQAWGFWTHGIDLSRATFAANDPIRVKTGHEIVWENGTGTKVAGLTITTTGIPRIIDAAGNTTDLTRGAWTTYTPTYTPSPSAGVTVTNNRTSYEIVGKTLRMQGQFQVAWTGSAPGSIQISLPPGVTLKHSSTGSLANISAGTGGGYVYGTQNASIITAGNSGAFGGSGSFMTFSLTAEIN